MENTRTIQATATPAYGNIKFVITNEHNGSTFSFIITRDDAREIVNCLQTNIDVMAINKSPELPDSCEFAEITKPEVMRSSKPVKIEGNIMSDFDIFTKHMGYTEEEANKMLARMKVQKLEDLKMQIIANNPTCCFGVPVKDDPEKVSQEDIDHNEAIYNFPLPGSLFKTKD